MDGKSLQALREERAKLITDARALIDKAEEEKRELTAEERQQWDTMFEAAAGKKDKIELWDKQLQVEVELGESRGRQVPPEKPGTSGPGSQPGETRTTKNQEVRYKVRGVQRERVFECAGERGTEEYRDAFNGWIKTGRIELTGEARANAAAELRALSADTETLGGSMVPSEQFIAELIQAVDDLLFVRQFARVFPVTSADSAGAPSLDTDPDDADWTSEIATGSEDSAMAFGKRELKPWPLAKRIKVSNKLLRLSAIPAESLVRERLAYKIALPQEKAYLTGHGANQPLGVFTASSDGISTGRDVSTGNTTTTMKVDGLIEAKYSVKAPYWPRLRWMFHRDGVKQIAKLKDGEGQYLWRTSVTAGEPDRLLSFPVDMSENVPSTFTTGLYVGILADWSNYWIADALSMTLQRLTELYAETNQVGFIVRYEGDGMPVLEEAFARVTLA